MLTYSFEDRGNDTLYEYLYKQIKKDINTQKLKPREKLPSKRALAKHLSISTITVENAYNQLAVEGYIYSVPRSGFFVSDITAREAAGNANISTKASVPEDKKSRTGPQSSPGKIHSVIPKEKRSEFIDFTSNSTTTENFPFATWNKLMRNTLSENRDSLMIKSPSEGVIQLREAIANYLYQFRGIIASPEQIVVGAGTEYLYGLIIQLLGFDKTYAVEDPGYQKISRIYAANKVKCVHITLDEDGVNIDALKGSKADVLHISPSHHFPTGLVTPVSRRFELLNWASEHENRYIIEDDYDSEFRLLGKPIPALQSIDTRDKVIYINTFSKSLTSTIRISYMVLPKTLMERYKNELSFYACTVSNFEQYTLAKFIDQGYFERHINRTRNYYRKIRDEILSNIKSHMDNKKSYIMEEDAGLHFLLKVDTSINDKELVQRARRNGIIISCLSQYYYDKANAREHILVINYSGIKLDSISEGVERLYGTF